VFFIYLKASESLRLLFRFGEQQDCKYW